MRLFKGNSKEFKYKESMFTALNEEVSYLCVGGGIGEPVIRIWDLRSNQVVQTLSGHKDAITTMLSLRDMHTIVSGAEDG
jgi:WD40 repeat protein